MRDKSLCINRSAQRPTRSFTLLHRSIMNQEQINEFCPKDGEAWSTPSSKAECPADFESAWTVQSGGNRLGLCFKRLDRLDLAITWPKCYAYCRSMNSSVAVFHHEEEFAFAKSVTAGSAVWVGASYSTENVGPFLLGKSNPVSRFVPHATRRQGNWTWVDGSPLSVNSSIWLPRAPKYGPNRYSCGTAACAVARGRSRSRKLVNAQCDASPDIACLCQVPNATIGADTVFFDPAAAQELPLNLLDPAAIFSLMLTILVATLVGSGVSIADLGR